MRIVVLDGNTLNPGDLSWEPLEVLGDVAVYDATEPDQVVERCQRAEVVLSNKVRLDRSTLSSLPELRLISVLATGYDVVDIEAAYALGITVCNVPSYSAPAVAEMTIALMLTLCRRVELHDRAVRDGEWARRGAFSFHLTPQMELAGSTLGIVGLGQIGRRVARIAMAMDMEVVAAGRAGETDPVGVRRVPLDDLFGQSTVISLHLPLTASTRHLVDARRLALMKPGALLINTARGALVDEAALAEALSTGHLGGAGLDVVDGEPIATTSPLLGAPRTVITPHMAWSSLRSRNRLLETSCANIVAYASGSPVHVVGAKQVGA